MGDREMWLRMIVAIVLSVVVLTLFQWLFAPHPPKGPAPQKRAERRLSQLSPPPPPVPSAPTKPKDYEEVVVETPLYRAVFTTFGGRLKSWKLKGYKDKVELHPIGRFVQGIIAKVFGRKLDTSPPKPVDLVNTTALERLPLALIPEGIPYDEAIPWSPSVTYLKVEEKPAELVLSWHGEGVTMKRIYTFYPDSYRVDLTLTLSQGGNPWLQWTGRTDVKKSYYGFYGPLYHTREGVKKLKPKKIKADRERLIDGVDWFAFDQDYFISLFALQQPGRLRLGRLDKGTIYGALSAPKEGQYRWSLFLGPKVPEKLAAVTPSAKGAIDYGTFGIIAVPILKVMNFTHRFTGNYGLDIILLALLIKIVFFPLTQKSQKAMKEMQKLGPEIKRLQQKYKDDRERLNRELMELYRRRRVNPFSGCLPLLLQLPVFFALYRALLVSIELRHAPFILWIRDLSDKDPTYITPLLMGATMFLQQRMTTPEGDPQQQKLMTFMPIIFTFLFLNFPSGLVLYWLATNVMGILHQLYVNRRG